MKPGASSTADPRRRLRRAARGAWFGLLAQAVDKLLPVVLILYLARALAPEAFGVYAFLLAYLAFFQALSDYSIDTVLVRRLSQATDDRARVLRAGVGLKLGVGLSSAAVATVLAGPVSGGQVPADLMAAAALVLPSALGGAYRAYLRSTLEIRSVFLIAAGRGSLLATAIIAVVALGLELRAIFLAMAAVNLTTFFIISTMLRHRVPPGPAWDPPIWRELLGGALPLFANALAMTLSLRIGQVLLMSMRGPVEVGLLAAASRVSEAFTIVPEALMITVYPLMADLYATNRAALVRTAERTVRYLVVVTGLLVIACAVAPVEIMTLLFGATFADAGPLLAILAFTALLGATGTVILNLLVAAHRETTLYRNTIAFALVNLALSVVLIRTSGAAGAAVALLATSAASQVALSMFASTGVFVRPVLAAASRVVLALIVAIAAGHVIATSALTGVATAALLYVVALVVLRVLNREEIAFMRNAVVTAFESPSA